jgi:hypothetical protein
MENNLLTLYLKESPLGLKYLGITSKKNPYKYKGSGSYWKKHLKSHNFSNSDVKTIILYQTYSKEELKKMGLHYSKVYDIVNSKEFANLCYESGECSKLGYVPTEETKKKLSEAHKGKIVKEDTKEKLRQLPKNNINIVMLDLDGNFVKTFKNIAEAAKYINSITTPICKVLSGKQKTCKNHIFVYAKDYDSSYEKVRTARYSTREIIQLDMEGNKIQEFISVTEAEKFLGIKGATSNISACCKGRKKSIYGFKWIYKN